VSYDYKIFRIVQGSDAQPTTLEEVLELAQPFESSLQARQMLSDCYPDIVWDDAGCSGTLHNDIGRFEFDVDDALLEFGVISVRTSHRQDAAATHEFLQALCATEGVCIVDEQTSELIGAA
jgi:hypothetical protein